MEMTKEVQSYYIYDWSSINASNNVIDPPFSSLNLQIVIHLLVFLNRIFLLCMESPFRATHAVNIFAFLLTDRHIKNRISSYILYLRFTD